MWKALLFALFLSALGFAQGAWMLSRPEQVIRLRRAVHTLTLTGKWKPDSGKPVPAWEEVLVRMAGVLSVGFGALVLLLLPSILASFRGAP